MAINPTSALLLPNQSYFGFEFQVLTSFLGLETLLATGTA
jgi:hypothetical protein